MIFAKAEDVAQSFSMYFLYSIGFKCLTFKHVISGHVQKNAVVGLAFLLLFSNSGLANNR